MNIGILDEFREKNMTGINRVVVGTIENLKKMDRENHYMFLGDTDYLPVKLKNIGIFFDKSREINLNYTLFSYDIQLVHSFYRAYDFHASFKCARVLTIHDLILLSHPEVASDNLFQYFNDPLRRCAQKADKIIADSISTKKEIVDFFEIAEEKIEVIYPGLYPKAREDKVRITKNLKKLENMKFLLSVSGLTLYKNQIGLMKAFRIFKERHPQSDLKLVLTGPTRMKMEGIYEELKKIPNYEEEVILTGYVTDGELIWLYQNCLAYALVSWYEGFGLTILEALSQGKAVISSNTTSMPEVGGDAVEYCDPFDIESIAAAIERVVLNDSRRQELEGKAKQQAEKFSYEAAAKKTLDIYQSFR